MGLMPYYELWEFGLGDSLPGPESVGTILMIQLAGVSVQEVQVTYLEEIL